MNTDNRLVLKRDIYSQGKDTLKSILEKTLTQVTFVKVNKPKDLDEHSLFLQINNEYLSRRDAYDAKANRN